MYANIQNLSARLHITGQRVTPTKDQKRRNVPSVWRHHDQHNEIRGIIAANYRRHTQAFYIFVQDSDKFPLFEWCLNEEMT